MREFSDWVFKLRGGIWTIMYLVIFFVATPTWENFHLGLIFVILWQLLRFWAAGSIGKYRLEIIGAEKLVKTGAFAFARNPLYFANGLIRTGWCIISGWHVLLLFIIAFLIVYVLIIIPREEAFFFFFFNDEYEDYCRKTGIFYPKTFPVNIKSTNFDLHVLWKSERHSFYMTVLGTALLTVKIRKRGCC
jgi:protein-S-isoprenylcysteine O-methyltransferase Ste14